MTASERATEARSIGHGHRENVAGCRIRADRRQPVTAGSLGAGLRETCGGRVDIVRPGVDGYGKLAPESEILAGLSKSPTLDRHCSSGHQTAT
jgi:hypothetical protein